MHAEIPVVYMLLLCLSVFAGLVIVSSITKQHRSEDDAKLEKFCIASQKQILLLVSRAHTPQALEDLSHRIESFYDNYVGRIDRKLFRHLMGELWAAHANQVKKSVKRPDVQKVNAAFPFWI